MATIPYSMMIQKMLTQFSEKWEKKHSEELWQQLKMGIMKCSLNIMKRMKLSFIEWMLQIKKIWTIERSIQWSNIWILMIRSLFLQTTVTQNPSQLLIPVLESTNNSLIVRLRATHQVILSLICFEVVTIMVKWPQLIKDDKKENSVEEERSRKWLRTKSKKRISTLNKNWTNLKIQNFRSLQKQRMKKRFINKKLLDERTERIKRLRMIVLSLTTLISRRRF